MTSSAATGPPSPRRRATSLVDGDGARVHPRPLVTLGVVLAAALVGYLGVLDGLVPGVVAVALTGLVVTLGWPRLVGAGAPRGATIVLGVTTLALCGATLASSGGALRHVPVAVAAGVVALFLHPLVHEKARVGLVRDLTSTSLGILVIVSGGVLVATFPVGERVAVVGLVSMAAAALVDIGLERPGTAAWMLPVAMLVGGLVGVIAHALLSGGLAAWPALVGLVTAGVALCLRRALSPQAAVDTALGALASGVASVLLVGPVLYVLSRIPIA